MNYQFIKLALALFFSAGFLFIPNKALTSPDHVVINEIQITGGTGHTTDDFVELFNPNNTPFNLKGHRLVKRTATGTTDTSIKSWTGDTLVPAYGFYLWANSGYSAISTTPDATTSESLADNNGIALRQGATDTGTIIDSLAWGTATNTFVEGAAYPDNPAASQSLERKRPETGSRQDTTNNSQDFSLQTSPSPQNTQSAVENITVATPGTTIYIPLPLAPATPEPGEVVINELVNDPSDGEEEWVELYNRTNHIINLSDWTLADGSKSITALDGSLGTDSTGRYLVIKSLKGNLNNDGDSVVLKYSETIIDQVTYGKWDDGSISNNGPVAPRGASLGRSPDGADSNRDEVDFFILEPTPGTANQLPADTAKLKSNSDPRISIAFNELYPNPPLGDEIEEYIELINLGSSAVDLKGWVLADEDTSYTINSNDWLATVIEPGKIWLLPRPKTKIALDNEGTEHLKLSSVDGKIKITLTYEGPAKPGVTYSRNDKSEWQWSTTPTPGTTNTITIINQPPQPVLYAPPAGQAGELIMFDASDSIDPEGETLSFSWSFGDGGTSETPTPSHIYTALRRYTVRLVVRDAVGNETSKSQVITINEPTIGKVAGETSTATGLVLTEFIPNPRGSDDNEWLELYNSTASAISTSGWKLIINNRTISLPLKEIPAEDYLVLAKAEGKFTLLNQGGSLTLEAPSGRRETLIEYGQAQEGASFALADDGWHWTNTPTPGNENIILENGTNDDYQSVVISELKTLDSGSRIKTEGMVSAAPGLMGEKLIFLSGSGIQVLLNNSLWPRIEPGDRLYVSGTLSRNSIGSKLVMRKNDTLKIIGHGTPPPPVTTNLTEVSEEHEAELITVTGRVSQSSNTYFTLSDGTESLRVLLRKQPEIKWPQVTVGMEATVTGFVTLNKSGPRLAARLPDDILLKSGAASAPETIDLSQAEPTNWPGYLLLTLLALILGGAYLWEHYHLPAPVELIKKYLRK